MSYYIYLHQWKVKYNVFESGNAASQFTLVSRSNSLICFIAVSPHISNEMVKEVLPLAFNQQHSRANFYKGRRSMGTREHSRCSNEVYIIYLFYSQYIQNRD